MSIGVRQLTVLGVFKPHGLTAEAFDGKTAREDAEAEDRFDYFLFDPDTIADRNESPFEDHDFPTSSSPFNQSDQEIFIQGNRVIWSAGSKVEKRYSSPTSVVMACWCHMESVTEALLCVLQSKSLSIYSSTGELSCIPLPYAVKSIWPVPHGLLLQKGTGGNQSTHIPYSYSSLLPYTDDLARPSKEIFSSQTASTLFSSFDHGTKGDAPLTSSHLILKHPLEEPQEMYVEERGKMAIIKDFDEIILWTNVYIPLMASYHKGKMKHSIWVLEVAHPESEMVTLSHTVEGAFDAPSSKLYSFRRIWQGTCSQSAASKVFWATDIDGTPIICFLIQEQKMLLSVRMLVDEMVGDSPLDIVPHATWTIHAIAAVPVVVTRPRVRICHRPFYDIVVLTPDNSLLLYSGKQCLCRYVLPSDLGRSAMSSDYLPIQFMSSYKDLKITGLADPVQGRFNVILDNGQMMRCSLRRSPSSSLVDDCISVIAEGVQSSFYIYFVASLWADCDSSYLCDVDSHIDLEWASLRSVLIKICQKYGFNFEDAPRESCFTSWEFLLDSKFHKNYHQRSFFLGLPYSSTRDSEIFPQLVACTSSGHDQEASFFTQHLFGVLESLHALYECLKLNNLRKLDLMLLVDLLCYIATSLGETNYVDYYIRDFPFVSPEITSTHYSPSRRSPPSVLRWLENCMKYGCKSFEQKSDLPEIVFKENCLVITWARKIVSFFSLLVGAERNQRKLSSGVYCDIAGGTASTKEELTVLAMVAERFSLRHLDLLPAGVSLPLRHALDMSRDSPPADWPAAAYVLIGREDLALGRLSLTTKHNGLQAQNYSNLTSICTPYTLPVRPVTVPSSLCDVTQPDSIKIEESESLNDPFEDGMEHMINSSTKLCYGRDLRLNEVRRLLCSAKPVAIQMPMNPSASDQELQQNQLWNLAQRTCTLPFGRGAFTLATTHTLLTEVLPVPKLVYSGRLPAQQNAIVNLDPNNKNISEIGSWPEFHNGVAAGLRLAPFQGKMSRTWIHYNKPEVPSVMHAGVLLGLGLHGHLRVLTITDVYGYLTQENDHTTVGILLGIAASHRGTMNPAISKMLYLHIPARHPSSFPELELPTLLQSAALLSVGLLYEGSAHPLNMKTLLGEIGRRSGGDNVLEREGYAVAAGSALGLVALGRGKDAPGFMENFVDRLYQYIGCKDDCNVVDGTPINVDVTAPGAIIALALTFLKTDCEPVASRLTIPSTHYELQYIRPDFLMLRIIARNLIMWNSVLPSEDWIQSQIPEMIRSGILKIGDDAVGSGFDAEALVQAYVNIIAGSCISLGLKFAGSRNGDAHELLYRYAEYFLNEIKPVPGKIVNSLPKGLSEFVGRGTLETCLHLVVLSLSAVMAGSGHIQTLRLLRFLRSRGIVDGHINYGTQMAVSLSTGFLFLGGGMQTFSTSNSAIAGLLITMYPRLPKGPNDNRCHLQAFRHLYAIAAESRWVQTIDVDTGLPVYAPLEVTVAETSNFAETSLCEVTPCLLPERSLLKTVRVCGPRYWSQVIHLSPEDKPWWRPLESNNPFSGGVIYIKRKVGVCSYVDDPTGCQSLLSRAIHKVSGVLDGTKSAEARVDQLVNAFSADPSLIAFAQLCCDSSWNTRSDADFQEFCSQVLLECVSKDRAALLQVYLSLYISIGSMWEQIKYGHLHFKDSLFLSSLKVAIAYNDAVIKGRLTNPRGAIIQPTFVDSLRKQVEEMLTSTNTVEVYLRDYLSSSWPRQHGDAAGSIILSWYLQWFGIPNSQTVKSVLVKVKPELMRSSTICLLSLLLPRTHVSALSEIAKAASSTS